MKKLFTLTFLCFLYIVFAKQSLSFHSNNFLIPVFTAYNSIAGNETGTAVLLDSKSPFTEEEMNLFSDSTTDYADVAVYTGLSHPRTGFHHIGGILLESKNLNDAEIITLTVKYDTTAQLLSCNFTPFTSAPGLMTFYFDTLHATEQKFISFEFLTPANPALLGHELWLQADVTSFSHDLNPSNNYDQTLNKITGSIDPNLKTVLPEGFGLPHYVPVTQEEFKYTIEFQNTGTDTAINIIITDTLSSYLDPLTVQPGASSHPYSWELLAPGILKVHFTNIFLPDSTTDEPRSHGFVSFTIKARQGLNIGTNIKNAAYIFFDFNSPVVTNTTANELFDCNNISNFQLSQSTICGGDSLMIYQNTVVPHISLWYVDSNWISTGDTFLFTSISKGLHQVILFAQTPYCTQTISQTIMVSIPARPVIAQNGFMLSTNPAQSYQWLTSGSAIPGAQAMSYLAPGAGWYAVLITDGNGCTAVSDSIYVTDVGIPGAGRTENISVSPNPFRESISVTTHLNEKVTIEISDLHGRILIKDFIQKGMEEFIMDTRILSQGIYTIQLTGEKFVSKKLITKN